MATHSSVLAWRIPGMAEPGGLLSMRSHRVGHDWSYLAAAEFNTSRNTLVPTLKVKVTQSCPTLCDPMDYTVRGILHARILEWAAFPFSRGSSQHRDRTQVSLIGSEFFTSWATRILEWVAYSFSRGSSLPRNPTRVCIAGGFFINWATREAPPQNKSSFIKCLRMLALEQLYPSDSSVSWPSKRMRTG